MLLRVGLVGVVLVLRVVLQVVLPVVLQVVLPVVLQVVLQGVCLVLWGVGLEKGVSILLFGRLVRLALAEVAWQ